MTTSSSLGRYRLTAVLGSGGFATVYLARDGRRRVAVKVLDREVGGLSAEVAALRRVDHRHCVKVRDVVHDAGRTALVTDYVEGASLRAVLDRHPHLDGPQALDVLRGALLGLDAVHRAGLVHGDVKPANVLLDRRGRAKVIDFGLARDIGSATRPGQVTGSPSYMAPEQIAGRPPDIRSDIYACAAVLYEALTGQRPFQADTVAALLRMHAEATPADPRTVDPGLSPELAALCLRGLAKNPDERPQSARAFLAELEQAARRRYGRAWRRGLGMGALVGSTSAVVAGRGRLTGARRRLRVAVTAAGAAAVIATITVIATRHARDHPAAAAGSSPRQPAGRSQPPAASRTPVPGSGHLVYARGASWHVLSSDRASGYALRIENPICCSSAALSPDGAKLLYIGEGVLLVSDSRGAGGRPVWSSPSAEATAAAWSPDGDRIAFAITAPLPGSPDRSRILTVRADGTGLTPVVTAVNVHAIAWSPDGSRLAFLQNQGDVWVVDAAGGPVTALFGAPQGAGPDELPTALTWGSRGTILFSEIGQNPVGIWAIDADGRHPREVLLGARAPSFAPDGVRFAAIVNGRIVVAATDGSPPRTLAPHGVTAVQWGG